MILIPENIRPYIFYWENDMPIATPDLPDELKEEFEQFKQRLIEISEEERPLAEV